MIKGKDRAVKDERDEDMMRCYAMQMEAQRRTTDDFGERSPELKAFAKEVRDWSATKVHNEMEKARDLLVEFRRPEDTKRLEVLIEEIERRGGPAGRRSKKEKKQKKGRANGKGASADKTWSDYKRERDEQKQSSKRGSASISKGGNAEAELTPELKAKLEETFGSLDEDNLSGDVQVREIGDERTLKVLERLRRKHSSDVMEQLETMQELEVSDSDLGGFFSDVHKFPEMKVLLEQVDKVNQKLSKNRNKSSKKLLNRIQTNMAAEQKDRYDHVLHAEWQVDLTETRESKVLHYTAVHGIYVYHAYHTLRPRVDHSLFVVTYENTNRMLSEMENFVTLNVTDAQRTVGLALPCWGMQAVRQALAEGDVGMELNLRITGQLDNIFDEMVDPKSFLRADVATKRATVKIRLCFAELMKAHPMVFDDQPLVRNMFTAPMCVEDGNVPDKIIYRTE